MPPSNPNIDPSFTAAVEAGRVERACKLLSGVLHTIAPVLFYPIERAPSSTGAFQDTYPPSTSGQQDA